MPGYDQRGPWGQGPRTGGGFGYCGPQAPDTNTDVRYGRRFGLGGRGFQRGLRRGFCFSDREWNAAGYGPRRAAGGTIQPDLAKPNLQAEAADLRRRLDAIERRLAGMENPDLESKEA
jgi:Family of unknown function (DUF5320)